MAEPHVGWVFCPGCGELIALDALRCERCGRMFQPALMPAVALGVPPVRWTIGLLMLLMVPLAVLLAVARFSPCLGGWLLYLFVLAVPRTRKVLALDRARGLPATQFDVVPAFLESVVLAFFVTISCVFALAVPIIVASGLSGALGWYWPWGDQSARLTIWLLGSFVGGCVALVLAFKVYRILMENVWEPKPPQSNSRPRAAVSVTHVGAAPAQGDAAVFRIEAPAPDATAQCTNIGQMPVIDTGAPTEQASAPAGSSGDTPADANSSPTSESE